MNQALQRSIDSTFRVPLPQAEPQPVEVRLPAAPAPAERSGAVSAGEISILRADSLVYRFAKRTLDLSVALLMLIVCSPLIAVTAAFIALDSPGPVLFRQARVGKGGDPFTFYKFRTMWVDAKERFPELYSYDYSKEQVDTFFFKQAVDPRLTRAGRWLRKTSLDELPNLINVLKGNITLVGPRPEIPDVLRLYRPEQMAKFSVKPGVTGLAQVKGRNILRFQETIAADLTYVLHRSFFFDLEIMLRTVWVVVMRVGAL